jgi:hypothetical protein
VQLWETRQTRLRSRARRRADLGSLEQLESRALLTFSTLGFSLPELAITGQAGPRAAWGGTLNVLAYLQNIGASSMTEPLSQLPTTQSPTPGSPYSSISTADAPDTTVGVYISKNARSAKGAVLVATIAAPPVSQNSVEQVASSLTLPARPSGFPGAGGKIYVRFVADSSNSVLQVTNANNISKPVAVKITRAPLPELRAVALSLPSSLAPGDTIVPTIAIENFGTANPNLQGPVTVDLVASVTKSFTLGSSIIASYTINSIPPVSQAPTLGNFKTFAGQIINVPQNVAFINGAAVTLPVSPAKYFLGVVVDPNGTLNQLSVPANNFSLIRVVGPKSKFLPAAGVVSAASTAQFPNPPSGELIGVH